MKMPLVQKAPRADGEKEGRMESGPVFRIANMAFVLGPRGSAQRVAHAAPDRLRSQFQIWIHQ